jgi:hypothetical protein
MSDSALIVRPASEVVLLPAVSAETAYASGGIEKIIESLEKKVRAIPVDISTEEGRQACASVAYQIARSKTALDDMGAKLTEEWRQRTNAVNADRRVARDRLDKLKAEFRAPLTNWENAQKERVAAHENALRELDSLCQNVPLASADIAARLVRLPDFDNRRWEEFSNRAEDMLMRVRKVLQDAHDAAVTREEEAAELARLRAAEIKRRDEEIERQIKERDRRLAEEAAENARQQAEQDAQDKIAEANERAARAEQEAAQIKETARIERHQRALASIRGMIADACSPFNGADMIRHIMTVFDGMAELKRDWQEFASEAAHTINAGREQVAERLAEVEAREEAIAAARHVASAPIVAPAAGEPSRERRQQVNRAILEAFMGLGAPRTIARDLVTAIARGQIANVQIEY